MNAEAPAKATPIDRAKLDADARAADRLQGWIDAADFLCDRDCKHSAKILANEAERRLAAMGVKR